ncbi:TEL2-interacting protein 1 [Lunasporangiospora selenospora]|uniref:TEL2-interacting protein 1 n=1 Tax=Lunasporangiospora selenospora TaxID=979761 RepID=A0A9P6FZ53_9FUNG|nr:TEL2-interacting protein 1 [Lunasporangiospora selenospora]
MGPNWPYDQMLIEVLFRALDGLPIIGSRGTDDTSNHNKTRQETKGGAGLRQRDRMSDETRLAALRCLILSLPLSRHTPTIHDLVQIQEDGSQDTTDLTVFKLDRSIRTKADDTVLAHLLEPANQAVLGQLIVILLDAAKEPNLVALRTTSLEGIMKLLKSLGTPERVASWLPGILAGLTKAMLERGLKENHAVLIRSLEIWTYMVVLVLQDIPPATSSVLLPAEGNESGTRATGLGEDLMRMYKEKTDSKLKGAQASATRTSTNSYGSSAWIKQTHSGLLTLFKQISPLRSHSHWMVRLKFAIMAFQILHSCSGVFSHWEGSAKTSKDGTVAGFLLETLISCTQDDYRDVYQPARRDLGILSQERATLELSNVGKEVMRERLLALPRILHGADESVKQGGLKIVRGLTLFLGKQMEMIFNYQTLWSHVLPWINVLTIEQLDQHNVDERGSILGIRAKESRDEVSAEEGRWTEWVKRHEGTNRKFGFPRNIYMHLREQLTAEAFLGFLRQVGSTTDVALWSEELISRLQSDVQSVQESQGWFNSDSVSRILLLNQLLLGAAEIGVASFGKDMSPSDCAKKPNKVDQKADAASRKKQRKMVKKAAKGVLEEYLSILGQHSQLAAESLSNKETDRFSTLTQSEDTKGQSSSRVTLAGLLHLNQEETRAEDITTGGYTPYSDITLQCMLLEGVASIAVILGRKDFEMELVRVLYILLEYLGNQDSALVRDTAEAALEHVAYVCDFSTIGDLIQANYDYVIQQVSQRIAFLSMNPETPQVLWSLIHVVGSPAVSMLEDTLSEIFEALDHWRNHEDQVAEGLLKALCEIVRVMAHSKATASREGGVVDSPGALVSLAQGAEISLPDQPSKEVEEFINQYRLLTQDVDINLEDDQIKKETAEMTPEQVKDYFMKRAKDAKDDEERQFGERPDDEEEENNKDEDMDEAMSFGELRSKMPKASKPDSKETPPTMQQALCLRILNKAGYFLTANSPRMRVLALETIQESIVVLKDRPIELNPAIYAFWPSIVSRILRRSDMEVFYVSLRAIEVVTLLAENCSDFLARHLMDDVWPFILKALRTWTSPTLMLSGASSKSDKRDTGSIRSVPTQGLISAKSTTSTAKNSQGVKNRRRQYEGKRGASTKVMTKEHRLQLTTLESVAKIVRKVRIPVQEIWEMLLLVREMMVDPFWRFHWNVRVAAEDAIKGMATAGHGDSVWLVMNDFVERCSQQDQHRRCHEDGGGDEREDDEDDNHALEMGRGILTFMEQGHL